MDEANALFENRSVRLARVLKQVEVLLSVDRTHNLYTLATHGISLLVIVQNYSFLHSLSDSDGQVLLVFVLLFVIRDFKVCL